MNSDLPFWLRVLAALGPTLAASATLLVGIMVATVAYRQWRTAHQKIVLDLFDKRFSVYNDLEEAALEFETSSGHSNFVFPKARASYLQAKFLFDTDAFAEINKFYNALLAFKSIPPEIGLYEPEKLEELKKANKASFDAVRQFRLEMPNIFERYLRMPQKV